MGQDGGLCKTHPNLGEVWIQALMAAVRRQRHQPVSRTRAALGPPARYHLPQAGKRGYRAVRAVLILRF